jgi:toxin ParE1/3/4
VKRRTVIISPEARAHLLDLYDWIADAASPAIALGYIERIQAYLNGLDIASERGTARDDIRPGLRIVGFERRITIAFRVEPARVTILGVFYAGRGWESAS